jgi:CDP-diacylglycerol--serine O-phosphatidyltransferase
VGLPIPAAAGMVAAVVYAADSRPLVMWQFAVAWTALLALLSFLMVSAWRYRSFKDFNLGRPRTPFSVVLLGMVIYMIWNFSKPVLLGMAVAYVGSGIAVRIGGVLRRRFRSHQAQQPEHQAG